MEAHQKFATHKPRVGDVVTYFGKPAGVVASIEGNLCWLKDAIGPFIWAFKNGVNAFHDWPARNGAVMAQHGSIETCGLIAGRDKVEG